MAKKRLEELRRESKRKWDDRAPAVRRRAFCHAVAFFARALSRLVDAAELTMSQDSSLIDDHGYKSLSSSLYQVFSDADIAFDVCRDMRDSCGALDGDPFNIAEPIYASVIRRAFERGDVMGQPAEPDYRWTWLMMSKLSGFPLCLKGLLDHQDRVALETVRRIVSLPMRSEDGVFKGEVAEMLASSTRHICHMRECETNCIRVIRDAGHPLTKPRVEKALALLGFDHGECTIRTTLTNLAKAKVLTKPTTGSKSTGYGLPEWEARDEG